MQPSAARYAISNAKRNSWIARSFYGACTLKHQGLTASATKRSASSWCAATLQSAHIPAHPAAGRQPGQHRAAASVGAPTSCAPVSCCSYTHGRMDGHPSCCGVSHRDCTVCSHSSFSCRIPHSYSWLQRPRCHAHSTRSCPCSCDSIAPPSAVAQGGTRGASHNQQDYCCVAQTAWAAAERTVLAAASHNSITSTNS